MPVETEIKLRLPDGARRACALLEQHGFREASPRQLESDQAFDLPNAELRHGDRLLRLRSAAGRWIVTYKGPAFEDLSGAGGRKNREEIEAEVLDGPAFAAILNALGYHPSFSYEKFRTTFQAPGDAGIVTLDETPIGDFLELEGPGYWIDQTAGRLGFDADDYITLSYAALYHQYCQEQATVPGDMKFPAP